MRIVLIGALGLVFAAGLGFAAQVIARDTVAEPVASIDAREGLAPTTARRRGATTEPARTRRRADTTTSRTETRAATTTTETESEHRGRGRGRGGDDSRSSGSGSSGSSGGDDD
ncbi:MAG TPA: hypothetical protein VFO03_13825 [Gaiellaceae bacterium]|nr:hypothetical protein [Gaiellaceae bacterium]